MDNIDMYKSEISFETANLLDKYNIPIYFGIKYYNYKGEFDGDAIDEIKELVLSKQEKREFNKKYKGVPAFEQSYIQKWLRKEHNIFVMCTQKFYSDGVNYLVQVYKYTPEKERCYEGTMLYGDNGKFKSYEVSLEFGLNLAIKMI